MFGCVAERCPDPYFKIHLFAIPKENVRHEYATANPDTCLNKRDVL